MTGKPELLREVRVEDAVGMVLAHDLTQILPGKFKGRLFKKGHVIREEDIPELHRIGKKHIYILHLTADYLHEDEAAQRMAQAAAGPGISLSDPHEGKISLQSTLKGLAKIDKAFVDEVNALEHVVFSTLRNNTVVHSGQKVAATRIVPLVIEAEKIGAFETIVKRCRGEGEGALPVFIKPFRRLKAGMITTGSEVYNGLIEDQFGPAVRRKLEDLGSEVIEQRLTPDDSSRIGEEIRRFAEQGVDLILVTGGMSVDPDDRTPGAIRQTGARIVSYGTPMLPGSMLMMAYLGDIPVMGLPGCVMHDPYTSFDVFLPRICAGETIDKQDIVELGYGGLYGC